jgi:hypothetical protein
MKKTMTILLMTLSFGSAFAIWEGPNGDQDCFGNTFKKELKKRFISDDSFSKICGLIIANGFSGIPFIETPEGEFIEVSGLYPKVYPYAEGCAYGKLVTKDHKKILKVSRYVFNKEAP